MGRTSSANGECRACLGAHRAHTCRDRGLGALPAPERLPSLKAYLLCCSCASAARGAAAALGVPPLADACWMDDDELVNELHELLSHEVLFVYVRWMATALSLPAQNTTLHDPRRAAAVRSLRNPTHSKFFFPESRPSTLKPCQAKAKPSQSPSFGYVHKFAHSPFHALHIHVNSVTHGCRAFAPRVASRAASVARPR